MTGPSTDAWDDLLDRVDAAFTAAASSEQLVDASTATIPTPVGELLLVAAGDSLVRIAFDVEDHDLVLADLAPRLGARILRVEHPVLELARTQLDSYFAGELATFDLPLDLQLAKGPFRRHVLECLTSITAGETRTYAELAALAGRPTAVRAAGSGCATNPIPIVVPCHRILRSGGDLGGYLGGPSRKRWLLDHERSMVA
jgi:methylated-DNA-[protein]-cysteine S-methyltransferase